MSAGTLYSWPESGNSYKVRLLAALLGLDLKIHDIDFLKDEQHQPPFLAINPRGEVPTLVTADNKTLTDSSSILVYLAGTYAHSGSPGPSTFWSTEIYEQAQIIDWLAFSNSWVQFGVFTNRAILSYNGPYNALGSNDKWSQDKLAVLLEEGAIRGNKSLQILQTWLETHEWLALGRPTIADVSVFVYVALAPMGDIALTPYPAVLAWIERVKKLPGFISIPGLDDPLPAVLASPDLTLLAVYSRTLASAKSLIGEDEEEKRRITLDIAAVTIALPITVQPAVIRRCLAAGKHVLSEKPIAPDIASALELLRFYRTLDVGSSSSRSGSTPTWSVAENQRFLTNFERAAAEVAQRGRVHTFRVRITNFVALGGKYVETVWRKNPGYQGGFVLDGGVHQAAGLSEVSAFSAQLQPHLPPVDTVVATARTVGGAVGTISISFGTREEKASEYAVGSEKGWVGIREFDRVVVDGKNEDVDADGGGVKREVRAWAAALREAEEKNEKVKVHPSLEPEQALADLELIEAILKSAEEGGRVVKLQHQRVAV
ncbi:hypothetical protein DV735_g4369, partial [Chaetothyriales sp. CBS 134920]